MILETLPTIQPAPRANAAESSDESADDPGGRAEPAAVPQSGPLSPPPRHRHDSTARAVRRLLFPSCTQREWSDWHWQLAHRIRTRTAFERFLTLRAEETQAFTHVGGRLPVAVTPYYASLIRPEDPTDPIRRMVVPSVAELVQSAGESVDPLGEKAQSPVEAIVHRYPDRVLFLVTPVCSTYCRYCTRSRMVGDARSERGGLRQRWDAALGYIAANPSIRDVLISGGDPLTLPDAALEYLLSSLRRIAHVEIVRIGTKVPMTLPQRVDGALVRMIRKYHPVWMSIHVAHPRELTREAEAACGRLADAGIPLGSQTVLLRGVNDHLPVIKQLMHTLLRVRVRPYYLYQCDPIVGSLHFRCPVSTGVGIIEGLRGHTSGYAVPHFVIDAPGGGGKIPVNPAQPRLRRGNKLYLRNYEGRTFLYPDCAGSPESAVERGLE